MAPNTTARPIERAPRNTVPGASRPWARWAGNVACFLIAAVFVLEVTVVLGGLIAAAGVTA